MSSIRTVFTKYSMKFCAVFVETECRSAAWIGAGPQVQHAARDRDHYQAAEHQPCRWCSAAGEAWVELVADAEAVEYCRKRALDTLHEHLWQRDPCLTAALLQLQVSGGLAWFEGTHATRLPWPCCNQQTEGRRIVKSLDRLLAYFAAALSGWACCCGPA